MERAEDRQVYFAGKGFRRFGKAASFRASCHCRALPGQDKGRIRQFLPDMRRLRKGQHELRPGRRADRELGNGYGRIQSVAK